MSRSRKLLASLLVLGLVGVAVGAGTYAAFSSTTASTGNSFASGTVAIADNDAGAAMLSLSSAVPGDTTTGCIRVSYGGSLDADVRLYGTVSGSLAPYLTLTVTRGQDSSPSFSSCAGFTADATNYNGNGPGVVYSGPLSGYPGSYSTGIVDPKPAALETWTTSEAHSYRFDVTLENDTAAQGLSATATFTWEARNR